MRARPPRRRYAMVLVLVFIALLLTFYSVALLETGTPPTDPYACETTPP